MTIRILVAAVGIALLLAAPVSAQNTSTRTFDSLSPGNQKIANALFSAQNTAGTTLTPLTKDQIAGLKGTEGWGRVFKEMKADGLIQAKNLGQVVSAHQHQLNAQRRGSITGTTAAARSGRATTAASARTHGRFSTASAGGRGFGGGPHATGGGVAVSTMGSGGFGHGGMGGGFGHGGGMGGGGFGGGHGGGGGRGR